MLENPVSMWNSFEIEVQCPRSFAWEYWADVTNWPLMDPEISYVTLHEGLTQGSQGITAFEKIDPRTLEAGLWITLWVVSEVEVGRFAVISPSGPGGAIDERWEFHDSDAGCIISRKSYLAEGVFARHREVTERDLEGYVQHVVPREMSRLAYAINEAYEANGGGPCATGLRNLDEVGPVPEPSMDRFQPSTEVPDFDFEYDGVIVIGFDEGGVAALTADGDKAEAAVAAYLREECTIDDGGIARLEQTELEQMWVVFEWLPESDGCDWRMQLADADDDKALQVHYLPV